MVDLFWDSIPYKSWNTTFSAFCTLSQIPLLPQVIPAPSKIHSSRIQCQSAPQKSFKTAGTILVDLLYRCEKWCQYTVPTGGWKLSQHKCEIGGVIQMEGMVCINTTLCIDHIHVSVTHYPSFLVIPLYLLLFWFYFGYLYIYTYSYFTNTSLEFCLRTQYCLLRGVKKLNHGWYTCTVA